jgi:pyridoxine 4-dehydrogenase
MVVNRRLPSPGRADSCFDEQLGAMVRARDEGLIAGVGLSNVSLEQLRHAADGTEIVCVQNLFHLAGRGSAPVLQECIRRGIAFVPSCPPGLPRGAANPVLTSRVVIQTAARLGVTPAAGRAAVAAAAGTQRAADPRHRFHRSPEGEPRRRARGPR